MDLVQLKRGKVEGGAPDDRAVDGDTAEAMNWAAVLSETQGRRLDILPPPEFDTPPADLAERAFRALYDVSDPEFPISLVDLGLIYGLTSGQETGEVQVSLSFTAMACPCKDFIKWDITERLLEEPGIERVTIQEVWDPPWSNERISERGRQALAGVGVSV
jgi:metal-sulfur cluster biosynthetic enzyme